jgi:hypothetical protein
VVILLAGIGCAEDYGHSETSSPPSSSKTDTMQPANQPSATAPASPVEQRRSSTSTAEVVAQTPEDASFVAIEEQGNKVWKGSATPITINMKNRGTKPLTLKVVNMLPAEHGFAIDTLKVKEVIKPGEERTIVVPLENIDASVSEHRVYCQLHPKHVAATLLVAKDQDQRPDSAMKAPGSQSGEVSLRPSDETEGQRVIREQSQRQRETESSSSNVQAPSSIAPQACEGFPGFDRGCPSGGR